MKLKIILLKVLLIGAIAVNGQFVERHWEEGDLSWEEFRKVDTSQLESASYFTYYIDYYLGVERRKDTTFYFFKAENFTDKNALAVVQQFTDSAFLEYHQVLFDISELARRRLQKSFFATGRILINGNTLLDQAYDDAEDDVTRMNEETDYGLDAGRLKEWRDSISGLIQTTGNRYLPSYELKNNSFGLHIGLGGTIHNGGLSDYVEAPMFFKFGINAHFKKIFTGLDFTYGSGKAKRDTEGENIWKIDNDVRQYNLMANVGYVMKIGRLQFIPYVGGGLSGYQYHLLNQNDESITEGQAILAPQVGAYLDFYFYKRANFNRIYHSYYNTTPDTSVESHGIRLNFSFTPVSFSRPLNASGNIFQISGSYVFHSRNMTVKN